MCAFNPEDNLYANTTKDLKIALFDCQLMTSNKIFSLNKVPPAIYNLKISKLQQPRLLFTNGIMVQQLLRQCVV